MNIKLLAFQMKFRKEIKELPTEWLKICKDEITNEQNRRNKQQKGTKK